jgi:hypothetical protein
MTAIKLVGITLPADPKPKRLRLARELDLEAPIDTIIGCRIMLRGPAVMLITKDGYAYEFARSACALTWSGGKEPADYDKISSYTSEVIARPKAAVVVVDEEKPAAKVAS